MIDQTEFNNRVVRLIGQSAESTRTLVEAIRVLTSIVRGMQDRVNLLEQKVNDSAH
jgi:hypothetical protein